MNILYNSIDIRRWRTARVGQRCVGFAVDWVQEVDAWGGMLYGVATL